MNKFNSCELCVPASLGNANEFHQHTAEEKRLDFPGEGRRDDSKGFIPPIIYTYEVSLHLFIHMPFIYPHYLATPSNMKVNSSVRLSSWTSTRMSVSLAMAYKQTSL